MAKEQYDVTKKLQRLFEEKQKLRQAIRHQVLKREGNPYLVPGGVVDPAVIRYHAMLTYRSEYAKPTQKNVLGFIGFIVIPSILLFAHLMHYDQKRDKFLREGNLTYEERYASANL